MLPYFVLFLLPAVGALFPFMRAKHIQQTAFVAFAILATLIMGLRYQVGADWEVYFEYLNSADNLIAALVLPDPGYMMLNWLSIELGLGIAGVNLIGSGIFVFGLLDFCRRQPFPWLGLAVAVPYLLIVVGMGYSRQAIALGFIFLSFSCWGKSEFLKYLLLIFLAATFHKTAVVMILFGLFMGRVRIAIRSLLFCFFLILFVYIFMYNKIFQAQIDNHITQINYESEGALVRLSMNLAPVFIYLFYYKRFSIFADNKLMVMMSGLIIASVPFIFKYSTVVDRILVYLTPIQVVVYSRLPLFAKGAAWRRLLTSIIVMIYGLVLWVWMNYGANAAFWVPYDWLIY